MPQTDNPRTAIGGNNPPPLADVLREKYAPLFERLKAWKARAARAASIVPETLEDCAKLEALFADGRDLANDADGAREREKDPYLRAGQEVDAVFNAGLRDLIGADQRKPGLARQLLDRAAARKLAITREEQARAAREAERVQAEAQRLAEKAQRQEDAGKVKDADRTQAQAEATEDRAGALAAQAAAPVQEASKTRIGGVTSSVRAQLVCTGVVRAELDLDALRPYFTQQALIDAVQAGLKMQAFTTLKGAAISEKAIGSVRR